MTNTTTHHSVHTRR